MNARTSIIIFAGFVWYMVAIIMLTKGFIALVAAYFEKPESLWLSLIWGVAGVIGGYLKTRFVLSKAVTKNIDRILAISKPKIWNVYPLGFYPLVSMMIIMGFLSRKLTIDKYMELCIILSVDIAVGIGLFASGFLYVKSIQQLKK